MPGIFISHDETASFDVDPQKTFTPLCADELPVPEGDLIVPELNKQAHFARLRIVSKEAHPANAIWLADSQHPAFSVIQGENVDKRWPPHAMVATQGFELLEGLPKLTSYDYVVWKGIEPDLHPYGSCFHDLAEKLSTGVIEYLSTEGINTIIVGGLATDYCVMHTVLQLCAADFQVIVNLGATRGVQEESTLQALASMRKQGASFIRTADDLQAT